MSSMAAAQHICATCRQPLSHVRYDDGATEWRHGIEPSGHTAQPVPRVEMDEHLLNPLCDFCMTAGTREASWVYPTQEFEVQDDSGNTLNIDDGQGWGACKTCYRLIEADNWDALAARAATLAEPRYAGVPYEDLLFRASTAHRAFLMSRNGEPIPATQFRPR